MKRQGLQRFIPLSLGLSVPFACAVACGRGNPRTVAQQEGTLPAARVDPAANTTPYPATPRGEPPVPLPKGEGAAIKHQRYIVVDQFGYRPGMQKFAILPDPQAGWNAGDSYSPQGDFEVRRWADASIALSARVTPWSGGKVDANSGDRGSWFNFTELEEPGLYYVYDPTNQVRSHPFEISEQVYLKVLKTAFRMFYFNRANFEKKEPFACLGDRCWPQGKDNMGPGQDGEAHSVTDRDNAKTARDLSGGWWDAGDTNKYVTFSGEAVHQLLTAYQESPDTFTDDFGIPESGNNLPDIVDEVLVELDWLKKMQPDDLKGGVLLKVGNIEFDDPIPEESTFKRYYYPEPCSSAAIVLAGEFAHGATVLRHFAPLREYASDLMNRAERAWTYYHEHPKSDACDDGTVKAGDADMTLERQSQAAVTAAVYLFTVTRKAEYGQYVVDHFRETEPFNSDQWSLYRQSQGDALMYYSRIKGGDEGIQDEIQKRKMGQSESIDIYRMRPQFSLYRAYLRPTTFHWGSNNQRASMGNVNLDLVTHGMVKSPADRESFFERAAGMLHSLHGVNPMQLVYLTNMYGVGGDACADEMYHTWFRDGHPKWDNARTSEVGPAPGYVTGGPNANYCDGQPADHACTRSPVRDQPPEKAYLDSNKGWEPDSPYDKTWELTEPAIYYQASYVRLVSKFVN
jgi:hypothetical protein